jgi:GTP-binding protein Era
MTNDADQTPVERPSAGESEPRRRVGQVGLAGVPNVGKSSLVNRLVGQKVSIVSDRPQTTREQVRGIVTDDRMQAVLVDVPGITEPRDKLGGVLLGWVEYGLRQCDLIWHLRDARTAGRPGDAPENTPEDAMVLEKIARTGKPAWLIWTKIDKVRGWREPEEAGPGEYRRQFGVSAVSGQGLEALREGLAETLAPGRLLYDPDQICDRDLRFLAGELVREQLFRHLGQEIPYGMAAEVETFDEDREGKVFIRVLIVTEREAHKPILIGKGGAMLKKIGQGARVQIEQLLGEGVFLELWVKVRPKWRSDERQLARLGLKPPISG